MADLTTIDKVKEYLGADIASSSDDALLLRLVTAASAFIEQQTGRMFAAQDYTGEIHRARRCVTPKQYPVISVASVKVNGDSLAASDYTLIDDQVYLGSSVFAGSGTWIGSNIIDYSNGGGTVELAYRAGYEIIPPDVEQAVIELAAYRYKAKDRISIANRSLASGETLSFVGYQASTASVDAVIEQYRRVRAA